MNQKLTIVMYHYVRNIANSQHPGLKGLEYNMFQEQIAFFMSNYNIIRMDELLAYYNEGYELPERALLLTFDDGYSDHFTNVYPFLKKHGLQGSFFVSGKTLVENVLLDVNKIHFILASSNSTSIYNELLILLDAYRSEESNYPPNEELLNRYLLPNRFDSDEVGFIKRILQTVLPINIRKAITDNLYKKYVGISEGSLAKELYMSYEQVKQMYRDGMYIGMHGYDHPWLGEIEKQYVIKDIDRSLDVLDGIMDRDKRVINYPYGSYSEKVIEYLNKIHVQLGMTTEVRIADLRRDNKLLLPRLDTNDFPPKSNNYKKLITDIRERNKN